MIRFLMIALASLLLIAAASAQTARPLSAAELQTLLANGISVTSTDIEGGRKFTGRANLERGGRLTGTLNVVGHGEIALNGTWKLNGVQICRTLGPAQPEEVCETWLRAGSAKAVTVQVKGEAVSVNRWQ
jgi:hypothetical protein